MQKIVTFRNPETGMRESRTVDMSAEEKASIEVAPKGRALQQITDLESHITPRRLREALMGVQESIDFIADIDAQIADLRADI